MSAGLVVVGASLAGLRAVEAARNAGYEGPITLIGSEEHLPYDRPPLSKEFLQAVVEGGSVLPTFRDEEHLRAELKVKLVLGRPACSLDTVRRSVTVGYGPDSWDISYEQLIIATGADARRLPGSEGLTGVHTLRTLDDAIAIRDALDRRARVVIIGAGFIGSELAAGVRRRGLTPTVVEALPTPLVRAVGERMGARLASLHTKNGTELRLGVGVASIEGDGGSVQRVVLVDGTVLPADLVVVGVGTIPSTSWLEGSGLEVDNGVVCDSTLWTGVEGVYAAGDVARWRNPAFDRVMRLEHWTSAAEQGAAAARNALDPQHAVSYSTVPYFWSDQYEVRIQFVGSAESDQLLVVEDALEARNRLVALYRRDGLLVGALTVNGQAEIMKYRALIARRATWDEAIEHAEARRDRYAGLHTDDLPVPVS